MEQLVGIVCAEHQLDCTCAEDEEFRCPRCNMLVGWCMGAADGMPEICDACWAQVHKVDLSEATWA